MVQLYVAHFDAESVADCERPAMKKWARVHRGVWQVATLHTLLASDAYVLITLWVPQCTAAGQFAGDQSSCRPKPVRIVMVDDPLTNDVRECLRAHIETYEQLEVLLVMVRCADQTISIGTIARTLGISEEAALEAVDHLCKREFVLVEAAGAERRYAYGPKDPAMAATIERLARAYDEGRLEIVKLMNANAIERVRTAAMRTFADAFILGGKKRDE